MQGVACLSIPKWILTLGVGIPHVFQIIGAKTHKYQTFSKLNPLSTIGNFLKLQYKKWAHVFGALKFKLRPK
jgi:hypothetical protein